MNKNQKGIIHFLLLIAIATVVFVGIGYYAYKNGQISLTPSKNQETISPTPTINLDETENLSRDEVLRDWKIFISNYTSLSFKHPDNWIVKEQPQACTGGEFDVSCTSYGLTASRGQTIGISFTASYETSSKNLSEYIDLYRAQWSGRWQRETTSVIPSQIQVAGLEAMKFDILWKQVAELPPHFTSDVFIKTNSQTLWSINFTTPTDSYPETLNEFNQILSTFKFFERIHPEWNIHVNEEFNFYFEYPKDWEFTEDYHHQRGLSKYSDLLFVSIKPKTMQEDSFWLIRIIDDMDVEETIQEPLKKTSWDYEHPEQKTELISIKDITFSNLPAKMVIYRYSSTNTVTGEMKIRDTSNVIFEKDRYVYVLPQISKNHSTVDQILSTFKFLK